ncbi:hypothetical protein [Paraglaciecola arctica]|uniref:hypothetical protein n=1 Tax=Paraglaciecola arctica TaxID=1128911 RepID=UPI001C07890E|nr:hypothetical protein [Paraglaciecola arctica]MBU3001876.1 hypothetical protein [Paraglaciecola arctica]
MSLLLNEHQIGFNTMKVGFPNLGDCMALALATIGGLYGFHVMPKQATRSAEFTRFFGDSLKTGVCLFGTCYRARRYGTQDRAKALMDWKNEMDDIAQRIKFTGQVCGFDTGHKTGINNTEATYVEYRFVTGGSATIHYKRMRKMVINANWNGSFADDGIAAEIGMNTAEMNRRGKLGLPFEERFLADTRARKGLSTTANIKQTRSNKGEMHKVKLSKIDSFGTVYS